MRLRLDYNFAIAFAFSIAYGGNYGSTIFAFSIFSKFSALNSSKGRTADYLKQFSQMTAFGKVFRQDLQVSIAGFL